MDHASWITRATFLEIAVYSLAIKSFEHVYLLFIAIYYFYLLFLLTTAWLAQLVECQSAVLGVQGLSPRPDQHTAS